MDCIFLFAPIRLNVKAFLIESIELKSSMEFGVVTEGPPLESSMAFCDWVILGGNHINILEKKILNYSLHRKVV